ncbi:MAG: hypothetical protein JSS76_06910 [Bacteroidetes bacterium]|nr:hypothetical protein [Bacteroidota bacterium]
MSRWSTWKAMPSPQTCRTISGPEGPGVYQISHTASGELVQFGISKKCGKRMRSLFPKPYGTGTRNNENKRRYILEHWQDLQYRTLATETREEAYAIETKLKEQKNHKFNT